VVALAVSNTIKRVSISPKLSSKQSLSCVIPSSAVFPCFTRLETSILVADAASLSAHIMVLLSDMP
jgi:hypothetical protein